MKRSYITTIEIDVEIEYDFTPGQPEQGPSYASGGEPAAPAEVEVIDIHLLDSKGKRICTLPDMAEAGVWMMAGGWDDVLIEEAESSIEDEMAEDAERRAEARRDRQ